MIPVIAAALVGIGSFFAIGKLASPVIHSMDILEVNASDLTLEGSTPAETAAGQAILNMGGRVRVTAAGNSATVQAPNGALIEDKNLIDGFLNDSTGPACNVRFKRTAIQAVIARAAT